jgi:hypothetical protein
VVEVGKSGCQQPAAHLPPPAARPSGVACPVHLLESLLSLLVEMIKQLIKDMLLALVIQHRWQLRVGITTSCSQHIARLLVIQGVVSGNSCDAFSRGTKRLITIPASILKEKKSLQISAGKRHKPFAGYIVSRASEKA